MTRLIKRIGGSNINDSKKLLCRRAKRSENVKLQSVAKLWEMPCTQCKWIRTLANACCDISLNITETPFLMFFLKCILLYHLPQAVMTRTQIFFLFYFCFFLVVLFVTNAKEKCLGLSECCLLKLMQAGLREWRWLHDCINRRGHFKRFSFRAFLNWSL